MKVEVRNGRLYISLKLCNPTPSTTGKTLLVASTRGVRRSKIKIDGKDVRYVAHAFVDLHRPKRKS